MRLHLCLGLKFFTTFLHRKKNNDREGILAVLSNVSKDFIGNIKESVDVTFASDDDERL